MADRGTRVGPGGPDEGSQRRLRGGRSRPFWLLAAGAFLGTLGTTLVFGLVDLGDSEPAAVAPVTGVVAGANGRGTAETPTNKPAVSPNGADDDLDARPVLPTRDEASNEAVDNSSSKPKSSPSSLSRGELFVETFAGNAGLERFRYGVYHRDAGSHEAGSAPMLSGNNNSVVFGAWTGDHDLSCGGADTQRSLRSDFRQDSTGENGWKPYVDFHTDELIYVCRDHLMTSMGAIAAYSVVWFSPDQVFSSVSQVCFDVNLTDLGGRQWWKIGVVSDDLFNAIYRTGYDDAVAVPGHVVSDVGSADLDSDLVGPDRMFASWSGAASAGHPGALKIGDTKVGGSADAGNDKATRHPVCFTDNANGTVTFEVAAESATISGAFPSGPVRVVFYDHNYTPDKDGEPIGHTWHWDNIVIR